MITALKFGDVINVRLPNHSPQGHEQEGFRPAIVVGLPGNFTQPRFPLIFIVPVTSDHSQSWILAAPELYLRLPAGSGGLRSASVVLMDQLRSLDIDRIVNFKGSLSKDEVARLQQIIKQIF